jgi:hypothetical protein
MVRAYYRMITSLPCNNGLAKLATMLFFERMHVSLGSDNNQLFFLILNRRTSTLSMEIYQSTYFFFL